MSDGTDQGARLPPPLGDAPFGVDERRFPQRVALAAALAQRLPFVDLAGNGVGHWGRFFDSDESLVLARMAAVDVEALQRALVRDLEAPSVRLAWRLSLLAPAIDDWWKSLAGCEEAAARAVRDDIEQAVAQRLRDDVAWLGEQFGDSVWKHRRLGATLASLSPMWRAGSAQHLRKAGSTAQMLRAVAFAFLGTLGRLQSLAAERLDESLATGRHEPAAALLASFLELRDSVRERVNRFASRHVDFYYRDCLGLRPAPARAGSMHLVCRRDPRAEAPVELPAGTVFDAGKQGAQNPIEFRTDSALAITDARVAALHTLRLERDALISPERDFGFATRVKVARLAVPVAADGPSPVAALPCHALFGGGPAARLTEDARLGLAVATPALALAEGEREIRLRLRVTPAAGSHPLDVLLDQLAAAAAADDDVAFRAALGPLFVRWLVAGEPLSPAQLAGLRAAATRRRGMPVGVEDPLHLLYGEGPPARALLFDRLVDGAFELRLSAAQGWWTPPTSDIVPTDDGGLLVAIRLRRDDPAIVGCDPALHGAEWTTPLPVLRLDLGTRGRLYAFSLLAGLDLHEATVDVKVDGLKELVVRNDLGRLDPTRSFTPFGPLPTVASSFVFGSAELACKHLQALSLHIEWGGLPTVAAGFEAWYRGYAPAYAGGAPVARPAILRDGHWQDCSGGEVALFAAGARQRIAAARTIVFDRDSVCKHARAVDSGPLEGARVQGGLFRVQLRGPEGAFGHAAYPAVLADAFMSQARLRRPAPRPNPPYTPTIEGLAVSYEASDGVRVDRGGGADERRADGARLYHLHPFGLNELQPACAGSAHGLLPRLDHDGSLLVGVAAEALRGPLALLFHLRTADAADPTDASARPRTHWSVLAGDRWQPLAPSSVLADTTAGFLKTGVVTLDLPAGLRKDSPLMPPGLFWLRLSADRGFEGFAGLHAVHAQAVRTTRVAAVDDALPSPQAPVGAGLEVAAVEVRRSVVGLAGVAVVGGVVGDNPRQDERAFRAGAGERLRHRQRASTAWDFERLVLDRYAQVAKAKCLAGQDPDGAPGRVIVAVVPRAPRNVHAQATAAPRLDADQLADIQAFLARLASPWARVRVRNAAYERIQVRCQVQAARGLHEGVVLRRIERAIVDYLSPWMDGGCEPRFAWALRCEDLQAHLRRLDGVAAVTRLSLLRAACDDDGRHSLDDTARIAHGEPGVLVPAHPWSLALPMAQHLVWTPQDASPPRPPAAGIGEFAIGSTFVLGDPAP